MAQPGDAPFFSLVMPVYGVERYIADAVADVRVQTFCDFELVIVDDCSPDRSAEVARAVAGGDSRVRIVSHPVNRGVSAARNTGIGEARGTWLLFPDPDDRYDRRLLERVREAIDEAPTDLVAFGHVQEYYDASGSFLYRNPIDIVAGNWTRGETLGRCALELEKQTNLGYPWNKAFRREIIADSGLRFEDDVPLIEDVLFNIAYLRHARALTCIPDVLYRYAKRLSSNLTNEFAANYYEMHRRRISEIRGFVKESGAYDDEARSTLGSLFGRFILSSIEQNASRRSGMGHADRIAWLEQLFADPLYRELVPNAQADDSIALAACLKVLKSRNVPALLAIGRAIHVVRTRNTTLYTKAKSRR